MILRRECNPGDSIEEMAQEKVSGVRDLLQRFRNLIARKSTKLPARAPTGVKGDGPPVSESLRERAAALGPIDYPIMHYDEEDSAREALKVVDDFTMCSYERMVTLWQQVRYLDRAGIEGCLVECGTWKGGAMGMMTLAHMSSGKPHRVVHLFDSFEGLPEPSAEKDGQVAIDYASNRASGNLASISRCVGSLEDNRRLLEEIIKYPTTLTRYHVGSFQDTVPAVAPEIGPIALLRLDGDWYESTRICIETLGPKVVSGGVVVIDDYGKWPGCRAAMDEYLSRLPRPVFINHIDPGARYYVVP